MDERAKRLSDRFNMIQQTLSELHGEREAFAAASSAWLSAVQYATRQCFLKLARKLPGLNENDSIRLIAEQELEVEALLQGFHKELCKELEVSQTVAMDLAKSFQVVIEDICTQKG